jgi:carbon storage regulator
VLVLQRKPGESIKIGDDIEITLVRVGPNSCRLGITAPRDVPIIRTELGEWVQPLPAEAAGPIEGDGE